MAINVPTITKVQRTNAILFFGLTLLPTIVLLFINGLLALGFMICVALRYVELFIINKFQDKLQ